MYLEDIEIVRPLLEENPEATDEEIVKQSHLTAEQVQFAREVIGIFSADVFEVLDKFQQKIDKSIGRKSN